MPKVLEILIFDVIGPSFFEDGITAQSVFKQLNENEFDEILVRINSPGGRADHGIAIYNLLRDRAEKVTTRAEGLAASAASLVFQAGDERQMAENSRQMIHDAAVITIGNAAFHEKSVALLHQLDQLIARTYAGRSGGDEETFRQQMDEETWFTANEALQAGLADTVLPVKQMPAETGATNSFDLSMFRNVPADVQRRFAKPAGKSFSLVAGPHSFDDISHLVPELKMSKPNESQPSNEPAAPATQQQQPAPTQQTQPATAQQAAPQPDTSEIEAQAKAEGEKTAAERITKIHALCSQAGKPELFDGFMEKNLSVAEAQDKLFHALCVDRPAVGEEGGAAPSNTKKDPDAALKKQYAENPHYAACGLSEEDYIAQCRRDEAGGYVMPKTVQEALDGV